MWLHRFRNSFRQNTTTDEIEREIQFHIAQRVEDLETDGYLRPEATRLARIQFGNPSLQAERTRDEHLVTWLETLFQDLRFAFRLFRRAPAFSLIAVLSLAVGVGATAAIFSLSDLLLLRPLTVPHPEQLLTVGSTSPDNPLGGISYPDYVDLKEKNTSFAQLAAFLETRLSIARNAVELPIVRTGMYVSGNFFDSMGIVPQLGRGFSKDEDEAPGRNAVAVVSHGFWATNLNSDPEPAKRRLRIGGLDFQVIGVLPATFEGPTQFGNPAVYLPLAMWPALDRAPTSPLVRRDLRVLMAKGRLRPGVSVRQADAEMRVLAKGLSFAYPATNKNIGATVKTEWSARLQLSPVEALLVVLLSLLAAAVLLVSCANVASLLLSRARARSRETAIRLSIGAGRARLLRQLLTESLVLALAGGVCGIALAALGIQLLGGISMSASDTVAASSTRLDDRVLLVGLAAAIASTVLFGLAPALQTVKQDVNLALKDGAVLAAPQSRFINRNNLVRIQIACCMLLVVVASTVFLSFKGPLTGSPGFRLDGLLLADLDPGLTGYRQDQTQRFFRVLRDRLMEQPRIRSVTFTSNVPMGLEQRATSFVPEGYQLPRGTNSLTVLSSIVDDDYFSAFNIPILRGRALLPTDIQGANPVAVVNEEMARKYWPGEDALGKRFRIGGAAGRLVQIAGIARTAKYTWIAEAPQPFLYLPLRQNPQADMTLAVVTNADRAYVLQTMRRVVAGIDSNQPLFNIRTMREFYSHDVVGTPTALVETIGALGLVGLLLAMVGLYGLVSYSVSQRTREIAVRMAMGAGRSTVLRMIFSDGLRVSLTGAACGLLAGFAVQRILLATLASVSSSVLVLIASPALVVALTLLAASGPALRASRTDPNIALRYE